MHMSLLFRVLVRGNTFILLPALMAGTGIYILTDLFERMDNFISADLGAGMVIMYFVYKTPLIVSQILPVVFLLSTVIQLCLMSRSRELTALYAGGISTLTLLRMLFVCGLMWSVLHLGFSQWLGVLGEQHATRVWLEDVQKRNLSQAVLHNLWFTEKQWIVSLGTLAPDNTGTDFQAYRLDADGLRVVELLRAAAYAAARGDWKLLEAARIQPEAFSHEYVEEMRLPLQHDMDSFRIVNQPNRTTSPQQLSLIRLGATIEALRESGSNVEALRTAWHAKLAYAASLAVMTLVAMAIVTKKDNIYIASGLALLVTFLYYAVYTTCNTLGQQGMLPPVAAAWLADILAGGAAFFTLAPVLSRRKGFRA
jgi:lipopolysaccharide export system permease protein